MDLTGKHIIVTGASSGIGLATTKLICELGGHVSMVARNEDKLREVSKWLPENCFDIYPFDLLETERIPVLVNAIREKKGRIGGLVHSAGDFSITPLRAFDPDEYRLLYDLHVTSFFMMSQGVCSKNNVAPSGVSIVAVSSIAAITGSEGLSVYSSVKGALISAVRSLSVEFASKIIRFNCVSPGWVKTPMLESIKNLHPDLDSFDSAVTKKHPLGLGESIDVANAICFLLSEASRWITGINMVVDGGFTA